MRLGDAEGFSHRFVDVKSVNIERSGITFSPGYTFDDTKRIGFARYEAAEILRVTAHTTTLLVFVGLGTVWLNMFSARLVMRLKWR